MPIFCAAEILQRMQKIYDVRTNRELAAIFSISENAVSNWNKRNAIPFETLLGVVQEKGVSLDWLIFGKEEQRRLDALEELVLTAFNNLDSKAKLSIISLIHNGGAEAKGHGGTASGNNSVNNVYSGDNLVINK